MRTEADGLPFLRELLLWVVPIFRSEIRPAPRQRGRKLHRAAQRFRNRTVFRPGDPEYFLPDRKGEAGALCVVLLLRFAHSEKFRATARRRMCPIQFSIEDNLPNEAVRKRRSPWTATLLGRRPAPERREVGKSCCWKLPKPIHREFDDKAVHEAVPSQRDRAESFQKPWSNGDAAASYRVF